MRPAPPFRRVRLIPVPCPITQPSEPPALVRRPEIRGHGTHAVIEKLLQRFCVERDSASMVTTLGAAL
jgi:hypothetical protein